jgi:hypothetical protein
LIKLMSIVSLVVAPTLATLYSDKSHTTVQKKEVKTEITVKK